MSFTKIFQEYKMIPLSGLLAFLLPILLFILMFGVFPNIDVLFGGPITCSDFGGSASCSFSELLTVLKLGLAHTVLPISVWLTLIVVVVAIIIKLVRASSKK